MSIPTVNDLRAVNPILTNLLVSFFQAEDRFIAMKVFPAVPSDMSGTFYKFTQKYWFTDEMQKRAPGGQYARAGFGVETDTYATIQFALAKPIADEERAGSQLPADLEQAAVKFLAEKSLLRKEIAWATDFMTSGVWGTSASVTKWSTYETSDPVGDISTGRRTISQATGYYPNMFVMGEIVNDRLKNHPDLLDRIKFTERATGAGVRAALAALFEVDQVLVGSAIYNSADEGQTASYSPIIDDDALLLYANPAPNKFEPSGGYTFAWAGGGGTGSITKVREDVNDTDLVRIKEQWDQKLVASTLGYFFADCTD